jgi:FtsP/CotA-like multicopper oxidase with cupredoxin domain
MSPPPTQGKKPAERGGVLRGRTKRPQQRADIPDVLNSRIIEEWTVIHRGSSDHSFHMHQNPIMLTHINGQALPVPEWRDTILVPAATGGAGNINAAQFGTVKFRSYLQPQLLGNILMHCHVIPHKDFGLMQRLEIKPGE